VREEVGWCLGRRLTSSRGGRRSGHLAIQVKNVGRQGGPAQFARPERRTEDKGEGDMERGKA
jgi:hypothetical protein